MGVWGIMPQEKEKRKKKKEKRKKKKEKEKEKERKYQNIRTGYENLYFFWKHS